VAGFTLDKYCLPISLKANKPAIPHMVFEFYLFAKVIITVDNFVDIQSTC
jgi:hypothetical protein